MSNRVECIMNDIYNSIALRDAIKFRASIGQLPISKLSLITVEKLLSQLISKCYEVNNGEALKNILSIFEEKRLDKFPILLAILFYKTLNDEIYDYIYKLYPEKTGLDYYSYLVNIRDENEKVIYLAYLLKNYLPSLSANEYHALYKLTEDDEDYKYHNVMLREFFYEEWKRYENFAPRPSWIKTTKFQEMDDDYPPIPSVYEVSNLISKDINNGILPNLNIETNNDETQLKDIIIDYYGISTYPERKIILSNNKSIQLPNYSDEDLFRNYGPVNTKYELPDNNPEVSEHICNKYGGCRMFLCTEFETMDEDGEYYDPMSAEDEAQEINEWFRGMCDACLNKIMTYRYAIRLPLIKGGWKGCFCSLNCMKSHIHTPQSALLVGRLQEQLNVIGINDL